MVHILNDKDLDAPNLMPIAINAVEGALMGKATGRLVSPPRHNVRFGDFGDLVFTVGGTTGTAPTAGFRVYDTFAGNDHTQLVAVWSASTAKLLGIILGTRLGEIRTGAIGGVAIRQMSRADAKRVGIVGSGMQARTQLEAAASVRKVEEAFVFSRSAANRKAFALEMTARIGFPVRAVDKPEDAVREMDIVICATTSSRPVLDAAWLARGTHVNTVGPKFIDDHELGTDVADRAALIATDSPEQVGAYPRPFFLAGSSSLDRMLDLAEIVQGGLPERRKPDDITLFCSAGLAGTEVIVASQILAQAISQAAW